MDEDGMVLSEQEKAVMENILSIQNFYQLKDHHRLISIIVNMKQAERLFGQKKIMISDVFDSQKNIMTDSNKASVFASKYTYQVLIDKFKRPKSFRNNMLIEILQKKLSTQIITSHHTRKQIWLLASGALFSMRSNIGLYEGLVAYPNYPRYYERAIQLDLNRTVKNNDSNATEIKALHNVLKAFSRRNPYIGYCQGLNFIAYFLLTMQFSQEESFWLLSQITETIVPMDYYTNMIGVACDQQIFVDILKVFKPKITNKFDDVGLDPSVLTIQWFVCLFTSSLPFYLVKIVWDRMLIQGTKAFIKTGIIILSHFEKDILATTQFYQIIILLQQGSKKLQISEKQFNEQFDKIYINSQGLKIARDLYRQFHIKQKLQDKVIKSKRKTTQAHCEVQWPLCLTTIQQSRKNLSELQIWIYRQQSSPKIIHDYLENKQQYSKRISTKSTINTGQQIVKNINYFNPQIPSQFVIGRMQHICNDSKHKGVISGKNLKQRKKDAKFLSMIVQREQQEDDKKLSNLKKILRMSALIDYQDQVDQIKQSENIEIGIKTDRNSLIKQPSQFQKSETIQFFNNFVANHQELAQMMIANK